MLASSKNGSNFAAQKTKNGPLAQLNRAFDYGSKGYRFESCRDHNKEAQSLRNQSVTFLFLCCWWPFGGRGHLCFDFWAFFLFLGVVLCGPALNGFPDVNQCQ